MCAYFGLPAQLTINDSSIYFTQPVGAYTFPGGTYNGLGVFGLTTPSGAPLAGFKLTTNLAGFTNDNVSFTSNSIQFNLSGTSFTNGFFIQLDFACSTNGPCITSPSDGVSPQSQFVSLSGTGTAGATLNVLANGLPVGSGTVVVDSEGNWEALAYVAVFGPAVAIQVQDQSTLNSSNTITVHPLTSPPLIGGVAALGPALSYSRLLSLRKADILVTADPTSAQVWFYGPTYTHTALYLGGDAAGTPLIAEAVTSSEAEANVYGTVRSVPLEHSLAWNGATTMTAWRPSVSLSGANRNAAVTWAQTVTTQGLPYANVAAMSAEVLAADGLFAVEQVSPSPALLTRLNGFLSLLNAVKNSTTSFICSTLVWRAYWEGTAHALDISTPNNITAAPGSFLGSLPVPFQSAFINQLGTVFVVPQTFATSPKLSQIF